MCKLRDIVIFLAGAEFFHTLSHILIPFMMEMPIKMNFMMFTQTLNIWAIGINAVVTIILLIWACKLSR